MTLKGKTGCLSDCSWNLFHFPHREDKRQVLGEIRIGFAQMIVLLKVTEVKILLACLVSLTAYS